MASHDQSDHHKANDTVGWCNCRRRFWGRKCVFMLFVAAMTVSNLIRATVPLDQISNAASSSSTPERSAFHLFRFPQPHSLLFQPASVVQSNTTTKGNFTAMTPKQSDSSSSALSSQVNQSKSSHNGIIDDRTTTYSFGHDSVLTDVHGHLRQNATTCTPHQSNHTGEFLKQFYVSQSQSWKYGDLFHPVTKTLTQNGHGITDPNTRNNSSFGDGDDRNIRVCVYSPRPRRAALFPHTMQQLLRCFSYFRASTASMYMSNTTNKRTINNRTVSSSDVDNEKKDNNVHNRTSWLLADKQIGLGLDKNDRTQPEFVLSIRRIPNDYAATFIQMLQDVWSVRLDQNGTYERHRHAVKVDMPSTETVWADAYAFLHPSEDVVAVRSGFFSWLASTSSSSRSTLSTNKSESSTISTASAATTLTRHTDSNCDDMVGQQPPFSEHDLSPLPRIGFLNREWKEPTGHRHVVNHEDIMRGLDDHFQVSTTTTKKTTTVKDALSSLVDVASISYLQSFDNMSMVEQVRWMSNIDILVTPHGAQMTSILFMPPASCVLELFGVGLYVPHWYGSLSTSCNHTHMALYTGNWTTKELELHRYRGDRRNKSRSMPLCPNVSAVVTAIDKLVSHWKVRHRGTRRCIL